MSKINKFKKSPYLFFKDFFLKKFGLKISGIKFSSDLNIFKISIVIHTGESDNALSHIKIWYDTFKDSGVEFLILTRHIKSYESLCNEFPNKNLIYLKTKRDIGNFFKLLPNLKACFYTSNTANNNDLLDFLNLKHIFIGHGDSDKTASAHKFFRVYDENWVAGNAHIDRFKLLGFRQNALKHVKVGRPNLKKIIKNFDYNKNKKFANKLNILYLPTWEGVYEEQDYSSLSLLDENINKIKSLQADIFLSIKLHPWTGKRINSYLKIENRLKKINSLKVISKNVNMVDVLEDFNLFVCDTSAAVTECLATGMPIFLYKPLDKEIKIINSKISYEEYCYIFSTPTDLVEKILILKEKGDYLSDSRRKAMDYILGANESMRDVFFEKIRKIVIPHE